MISKLGIVVLLFFVFSDSDKRTAHYCPQAETCSERQRVAPKSLSNRPVSLSGSFLSSSRNVFHKAETCT